MSQRSYQSIRMMKLLTFLVVGLVCTAVTAQAQNLVQNGGFDFDAVGWSHVSNAEISFRGDTGSPLDGGSGPGCVELQYFFWNGGTVIITRRSNGGSFRAYTSTVDQNTGDAVYNPGQ